MPPRRALTEHRPPTEQERRFAEQYLVDLDANGAAIRAGYSPDVARTAQTFLMWEPQILAEIERLKTARSLRTHVDHDRVVLELSRIALVDPLDAFDVTEGGTDEDGNALPTLTLKPIDKIPEDTRRAIESIEVLSGGGVKIKFASKLKALEMVQPHVQAMQPKVGKGRKGNELQRDFNRALEIVERARQRAKGLPQRMKSETISRDGSRTIVEVTLEEAPPAEQDVTP
jgi:phage terminase small subunit